MIVEGNGIRLDVQTQGSYMSFRVLEQTKEATKVLRALGHVRDDETGFTLRSNEAPSYNRKLKRFFVRGLDKSGNDKTVEIQFKSSAETTRACAALQRLLNAVVLPEGVDPGHNDNMKPLPGGTTHVRFAFINRSMAKKLQLTAHKHYPEEVIQWEPGVKPIVTINRHYNEHISQGVDVLNKSCKNAVEVRGVVNPHRVTPTQARQAVEALRRLFREAEEGDYLVAAWRMVTAIRGPDFVDPEPEDEAAHP